jgi:hypothetical protein
MVIARTTAPQQVLPHEALGRLATNVDASGVVLGRDSAGQPVLVRLFGPEPLSVTFIGGWWAAQILLLRCLAHGATLVVDAVDTTAPASTGTLASMPQWLALDRLTGGTGDRVRPMAGDASAAWPASAARPLLRLHDVGPSGPAGRPELQAWQTQLTVLSRLTPASLQTVAGADVVLVQRLDQPEAALVGSALLLAPEFVARLGALDNQMVAAFRGAAVRYVWLAPTTVERQAFG